MQQSGLGLIIRIRRSTAEAPAAVGAPNPEPLWTWLVSHARGSGRAKLVLGPRDFAHRRDRGWRPQMNVQRASAPAATDQDVRPYVAGGSEDVSRKMCVP